MGFESCTHSFYFSWRNRGSPSDAYIHTLVVCRELYLLVFISTFPAKVNTAFALQAVELGWECSSEGEEGFVFSDLYSSLENLCRLV